MTESSAPKFWLVSLLEGCITDSWGSEQEAIDDGYGPEELLVVVPENALREAIMQRDEADTARGDHLLEIRHLKQKLAEAEDHDGCDKIYEELRAEALATQQKLAEAEALGGRLHDACESACNDLAVANGKLAEAEAKTKRLEEAIRYTLRCYDKKERVIPEWSSVLEALRDSLKAKP